MRIFLAFTFLACALVAGCTDTRRSSRDAGIVPGSDAMVGCGALSTCSSGCADLTSDRMNCGECGLVCLPGQACVDSVCSACTPSCGERECGDDGCGGSCGTCTGGLSCVEGLCQEGCVPDCFDAECGSDGCGGTCGTCETGTACLDGLCEGSCEPDCFDAECGSDGCGGTCGTCTGGLSCVEGYCESTTGTLGESCALPQPVTAGVSAPINFVGRVSNHVPFDCGSTSSGPDVVFSWTAPSAGFVIAETTGSNDVVLEVYSSSSCTTALDCDDDGAASSGDSLLELSVSAGVTYYFAVAPYGGGSPTGSAFLLSFEG